MDSTSGKVQVEAVWAAKRAKRAVVIRIAFLSLTQPPTPNLNVFEHDDDDDELTQIVECASFLVSILSNFIYFNLILSYFIFYGETREKSTKEEKLSCGVGTEDDDDVPGCSFCADPLCVSRPSASIPEPFSLQDGISGQCCDRSGAVFHAIGLNLSKPVRYDVDEEGVSDRPLFLWYIS